MNPTYEVITTPMGGTIISATYDNGQVVIIPTDSANTDYQAYLESLEETA